MFQARLAMTKITVYLAILTLLAMTSLCNGVKVIDLTYALKEGEHITWPTNPAYNFTILTRGHSPKWAGAWVEGNRFEMVEHFGTHMDAPSHISQGKWRMHQIPVSRLVGPGVVIDITAQANKKSDYSVTVDDFKAWESKHGEIPAKAVVLVNAGWGRRYPVQKRIFDTDDMERPKTYKFPSVTTEAARWLAEQREIIALGVDTPTPDLARDLRLPVHEILLGKNILILENVASLHTLPPTGTTIIMGAINIYDGSGAPMRILALTDMECKCNSGRDVSYGNDCSGGSDAWSLFSFGLSLSGVLISVYLSR